MKPIVTLTLNPSIDDTAEAEVVKHTHKIRITNEQHDPGGGGINVTRVIQEARRRWLDRPLHVGRYDGARCSTSFWLRATFRVEAHSDRPVDPRRPSRLRAVDQPRTAMSEGPEVSEIEWKRCLYALKDLEWDWCVGSGSLPRGMPENFYVQLTDLVIERGGNLVLDTSGKPLEQLALERGGITLFKPSERRVRQAGRAPSPHC